MNKEELLNKINLLLDEARELKSLALKEKPVKKTGRVWHIDDLKGVNKYFIVYSNSNIYYESRVYTNKGMSIKMGCVFYDEQSAKNYRDARLLAHECRIAMAESWQCEDIDWDNEKQSKYCFDLVNKNSLEVVSYLTVYKLFAFRRKEHAQAFINKHGEDAVINMILNG